MTFLRSPLLVWVVSTAVLCACICMVEAWGPVTHQGFGRILVSTNSSNLPPTLHLDSFVLGNSAPDAIKHLNARLHTFEYATYQLRLASTLPGNTSAFDPVSFSLGYGCHLAEDYVGHHNKGYLNPAHDHESEAAVDTYYHHRVPSITGQKFPWLSFSPEGLSFVSEATEFFAQQVKDPVYSFNVSSITASNADYQHTVDLELLAIAVNFVYKVEMEQWDTCPTSSFEETEKHLLLSQDWSLQVCQQWIQMGKDPGSLSPGSLDATIKQHVQDLYSSNGDTSCVAQKPLWP